MSQNTSCPVFNVLWVCHTPSKTFHSQHIAETSGVHRNLPRCHVDSNLRNNRWIEGVPLNGGYKLTRLCPFIPGAPRESEKLAAYGVLMHGAVRYGFVRTPEDGDYVASSGAAPYTTA